MRGDPAESGNVVEKFRDLEPGEFTGEIDARWNVARRLIDVVKESVEATAITPIEGLRIIASATSAVFGYEELQRTGGLLETMSGALHERATQSLTT